jgi:cytoskeletal protein CcmA (bactofilin family)
MWNRGNSMKNEGAPQTTPPAGSPQERRTVAWVGKSVIFRGDLISAEDMTIDGRIEGSIEVRDHYLTVGPNADIEADIVAKSVTIFGKIVGNVTSREKVEIRMGASVEADLSCQTLAIQEGAYFCGKVTMAGDQRKAKTEAAEAVAAGATRK